MDKIENKKFILREEFIDQATKLARGAEVLPGGINELAEVNISKSRYTFNLIKNIDGFTPLFDNSLFFNEFIFKTTKNIKKIEKELLKKNILGPLSLVKIDKKYKDCIMFAVTEKRTKQEIDDLVDILKNAK